MDNTTRRLLLAMGLSMVVLVVWMRVLHWLYPPPPRPPFSTEATTGAATRPFDAVPATAADGRAVSRPAGQVAASGPGQGAALVSPAFVAEGGGRGERFQLGSDVPARADDEQAFWVALQLTSRGGAVEHADLTAYRNTVPRGRHPAPDTYDLLAPWIDPSNGQAYQSFATRTLRLIDEKQDVPLASLEWRGRKEVGGGVERVIFEADVLHADEPLLLLRKTFALKAGGYDMTVRLEVENRSDRPVAFLLNQDGPIGLRSEQPRWPDRYILSGVEAQGEVSAVAHRRKEALKADGRRLDLTLDGDLRWAAHTNKWFLCVMTPIQTPAEPTMQVAKAWAVARSTDPKTEDDLQMTWTLRSARPLPAGAVCAIDFDVYLGPKDRQLFARVPVYASRGFEKIVDATGRSCAMFTFRPLTALMRGLLRFLHRVLRLGGLLGEHNYGWAIIVMVLIVRTILHPLTKRGQINMMRNQKRMAGLQPKIEALKARYANDAAQLNREQMKLFREEGISPFAQLSGCLPNMIQMPIWVALWTTLNTTIELRHEPFILWMRDLAAPDAMIRFSQAFNVPLLQIMTGPIHSLNLLPFVMGLTMFLQQKVTQRLTRPDQPAPTAPAAGGRPSQADQLKQQAMIMNFMSIFFIFMFYNFPCGLNLYIFTSNVFAMVEQWRIRKHIHPRDLSGRPLARPVRQPARRPRWYDGFHKKIQEIQKRADAARLTPKHDRPTRRTKKQRAKR